MASNESSSIDKIFILRKSSLQHFSRRLVSLKYIQFIQEDLKSAKVNKLQKKIGFLNQSYLFHLVASWQSFVESLVREGLEDMLKLNEKPLLDEVLKITTEEKLRRFNTPNAKNIDRLFKEALGIEKITDVWNWEGSSREQSANLLSNILVRRHEIAHVGVSQEALDYESNFEKMRLIYDLAAALQFALKNHLKGLEGISCDEQFIPPSVEEQNR